MEALLASWATWLQDRLGVLAVDFVSPLSRVGVLAIILGWIIGAFAYRHYFGRENFSLRGYLRHAFPRRVYASQTFLTDVKLVLFTYIAGPTRIIAKTLSVAMVASAISVALAGAFGPNAQSAPTGLALGALGLALFLAFDFGTYVTHRISHQMPTFWAFHRVHHSAEELNPLTLLRKHPVYSLLGVLIDCFTVAPLQGVVLYLFGAQGNLAVIAISNGAFLVFAYAASSLRHTHIWLSYGPVLDRIFVSPALHQIHHSKAERHWDKNFGEVLAIWDTMLGTLYLPREREELEFGIAGEPVQPHPGLRTALLEPFAYAWRALRRRATPSPPRELDPAE